MTFREEVKMEPRSSHERIRKKKRNKWKKNIISVDGNRKSDITGEGDDILREGNPEGAEGSRTERWAKESNEVVGKIGWKRTKRKTKAKRLLIIGQRRAGNQCTHGA